MNSSRVFSVTGVVAVVGLATSAVLAWRSMALRQSPAQPAANTTVFKPAVSKPMVQRLAEIERDMNPEDFPFYNVRRAEILKKRLSQTKDANERLSLEQKYIPELLNAGDSQTAIHEIAQLRSALASNNLLLFVTEKPKLLLQEAVAYLRLGEQQNCLENHSSQSCLAPIQGSGIHKNQYGSRQAIRVLTALLRDYPDQLTGRWLLNLAYMTVGGYPGQVPVRWLIPPKAFESDYPLKRFSNVADAVGLGVNGLAGGAIMEDFDNDGYLDIVCSSKGLYSQLQYFHNNGDGSFTERTNEAGLRGELGGLNLSCADYNNDGYPDILVLRGSWFGKQGHHPLSLLRNNRDGTFTDVTEAAGLLRFHPTETAAWFDYDGDGWLDLFVGNESVPFLPGDPLAEDPNPCELFHNNGDGTFSDRAAESGVAKLGYVKCVTAGDYNNDGRPDLYISFLREPNVLFRNDGPDPADRSPHPRWKFTDVTKTAGVAEPVKSFPCFFFDYDNDGWLDLFVCGYDFRYLDVPDLSDIVLDSLGKPNAGAKPRLYHNNGDGTFTDVAHVAHLDKVLHAMAANYGDFDNDGFLDFYLGTGDVNLASLMPNRMFRNAGGMFFQDVTTAAGVGNLQKGHGIAIGDIDNDGDQDIYEDMGGSYQGDTAYNCLYENPGNGNHWLKLKLEGVRSNRQAIGTRIKVTVRTPQGQRDIYRTVSAGSGFGNLPSRQEIGLGQAQAILGLEVFWPATGQKQSIRGLSVNKFYRIREGDAQPVEMPLKTIHLRHTVKHNQMPGMPEMAGR